MIICNIELVTRYILSDPPQFLHPDQMDPHVTQHTGSTVRLTCKASGKPKPEVTWYKNGVALQTAEVNNDIMDRWMLKIVDIQGTDNGRYLCKVVNKAGAINFTYNVHVTGRTMRSRRSRAFQTELTYYVELLDSINLQLL